jgi:hypothetical protein
MAALAVCFNYRGYNLFHDFTLLSALNLKFAVMKSKYIIVALLIIAIAFIANDASAQCAMCKMTAEDGMKDGNSQTASLNSGILYLLVMPYLSFAVIAFLWWRNYKRKKASEEGI